MSIDYINDKELDEFVKLIIESYLYRLKNDGMKKMIYYVQILRIYLINKN